MPLIVSPKPRLPQEIPAITTPRSIPRLLSPINIVDRRNPTKSPPPTTRTPTRRRAPASRSSHRRRRHPPRSDCPFESINPHVVFDTLPWISALDSAIDISVSDIADLSQLIIPSPDTVKDSGLGPVRRRKTSLRSNPLSSEPPSPLRQDCLPTTPSTPRTRTVLLPSQVRFHHLLPMYPPYDSHKDESS